MKHRHTSLVDLITYVLFVPFLLVIFVSTGLVLGLALNLPSFLTTTTPKSELHQRHYVLLPPAKEVAVPAPTTLETDSVAPEVHKPAGQVAPAVLVSEADPLLLPADIAQDMLPAPKQTAEVEEAPAESVALEPEIPTTLSPISTSTTEGLPADDSESPFTNSFTFSEPPPDADISVPASVAKPPQDNRPVQMVSSVPPPDVSYFDKLLQQVNQ